MGVGVTPKQSPLRQFAANPWDVYDRLQTGHCLIKIPDVDYGLWIVTRDLCLDIAQRNFIFIFFCFWLILEEQLGVKGPCLIINYAFVDFAKNIICYSATLSKKYMINLNDLWNVEVNQSILWYLGIPLSNQQNVSSVCALFCSDIYLQCLKFLLPR